MSKQAVGLSIGGAPEPPAPCCASCNAWRRTDPPGQEGAAGQETPNPFAHGLCRAHPAFVQHRASDWCREYQARETAPGAAGGD